MQHHSPAEERLYALIGDSLCDLSPRFIATLETVLRQQRLEAARHGPDILKLMKPDARDENERALHEATCQRWRRTAIVCRRSLESLSAILEILESAHAEATDAPEGGMLAPRLVEGLIIAGRRLADTALQSLDASWE